MVLIYQQCDGDSRRSCGKVKKLMYEVKEFISGRVVWQKPVKRFRVLPRLHLPCLLAAVFCYGGASNCVSYLLAN